MPGWDGRPAGMGLAGLPAVLAWAGAMDLWLGWEGAPNGPRQNQNRVSATIDNDTETGKMTQ